MHTSSLLLKHFEVIRRCGSIREAARRLHISSSALNRQILQLEGTLGFPLFDRLPGGLRLTPAGEIVARHGTSMLQDEQRMIAELDALRGVRRGSVSIATVESLTSVFIPAVLERMLGRHPNVRMSVRISGSADAAAAVANGDVDVAIAFVRQRSDQIRQLAAGRFRLGAIVPPDHPLAGRKSLTLAECAQHPLVLPSPELSLHDDLRSLMDDQMAARNVVLQTGSFELLRGLAMRGIALAFANRFGIERELDQGLLRHIPIKGVAPYVLGAYIRAERTPPPALDALIRIVAEELLKREKSEKP